MVDPNKIIDVVSQIQVEKESSSEIKAQLKKWQSTVAAVRGISMSVAALDPHKVAPIICASVFFGIDVCTLSLL